MDRSTEDHPASSPAMELFDTTHLALERALAGTTKRQAVLAGNLANVNTPGYVRRDVDFQSSLRSALSDADPREAVETVTASESAVPGAVQPDGNGVDLDLEAAKMAENGLLHQALASTIHARDSILRSAMGVA